MFVVVNASTGSAGLGRGHVECFETPLRQRSKKNRKSCWARRNMINLWRFDRLSVTIFRSCRARRNMKIEKCRCKVKRFDKLSVTIWRASTAESWRSGGPRQVIRSGGHVELVETSLRQAQHDNLEGFDMVSVTVKYLITKITSQQKYPSSQALQGTHVYLCKAP